MRKAPFTVLFLCLEKGGETTGGTKWGEKLATFIRSFTNIYKHIKNARRLCVIYVSVDFIALLAYSRLSGGEGGIRTHGPPLRSHWFSRPAP